MSTDSEDCYSTPGDIDNDVQQLRKSKMQDIGTERWWVFHDKQQKLSQQALKEVQMGLHENVKLSLVNHNKMPVLVHEAICISIWKDEIFPNLSKLTEDDPVKNFLVYMVLYHETSAVTLMEAVLYHQEACSALGDNVIDLIDYCAVTITSLLSGAQNENLRQETSIQIVDQEQKLTFGVRIRCLAIIQYIAEHMESLHLSAVTRLYQTHDFPMLLTHLIEAAPWNRSNGNKIEQYTDGVWREAKDGHPISRTEAHAWLAIHQLLLFQELGKYYQMTDFARGQLMKLDSKITEWLLNQLPPLHQLKQGLLHLSRFQLPSYKQPIILEVIPEIRNEIMQEKHQGTWHKMIQHHSRLLFDCPSKYATEVAGRLCKTVCSAASNTNVCEYCFRPAKNRCSRCKAAWYCSRQCQVTHFSHHKKDCSPLTGAKA